MARIVFLTLLSIWYLTSIVKLPLLLGLCVGFLAGGLAQRRQKNESAISVRWALSFLLSCVLLGFSRDHNLYPGNVVVLVAAGWALVLVYCGAIELSWSFVRSRLQMAQQQDLWATRIFLLVWCGLVSVGLVLSLKMGLSWDAVPQQETFERVLNSISFGLQGHSDHQLIESWLGRYYGVGFHVLAFQWHMPLAKYLALANDIPMQPAIWLSRHGAVFALFAISSLLVAWLVHHVTSNLRFAMLSAVAYLLYPYLLGHGMFNIKDSPFAAVWLLGVVVAVKVHHQFVQTRRVPHGWMVALILIIAWLISIRVAGILFAVPLLFLFLALYAEQRNIQLLIKQLLPSVITGGFWAVLWIMFLYPVTWQNPMEFLRAITQMSSYPWEGCTLTNGQCMDAQSLPLSYIPHWLLVKLPIFVGLGLLALPWVVRQLYRAQAFASLQVLLFLWLQVVIVLALLMLKGVALYDEIRQILFVVPVLFLAAAITLYFLHRRLAMLILVLSASLFAVDNVKIWPYQLAWFNEATRLGKINDQYETEYWGTGLRNVAKGLMRRDPASPEPLCVFAVPYDVFRPFLKAYRFPCQGNMGHIQADTLRPFLYVKPARDSLSLPVGCRPLHQQTTELMFGREPIKVAEIGICE